MGYNIDRHIKGRVHNHKIHLQPQIVQYLHIGPASVPGTVLILGVYQLEQGVKVQSLHDAVCSMPEGVRRRE